LCVCLWLLSMQVLLVLVLKNHMLDMRWQLCQWNLLLLARRCSVRRPRQLVLVLVNQVLDMMRQGLHRYLLLLLLRLWLYWLHYRRLQWLYWRLCLCHWLWLWLW
jgi:hypothetical protein